MPMLRFLLLRRRRLDVLGFDPETSMYRAIDTAYVAIQDLYIVAHREAVGHTDPRAPEQQSSAAARTDRAQYRVNQDGYHSALPGP
jgi:hypothetical protein